MQKTNTCAIIHFEGNMEKKKTILIAVLTAVGFLLTVELSLIFFKVNFNDQFSASFCSVNNLIDCDGVAKTSYSMFLGIPLALWGMLLYTVVIFLNFVHIIQDKFKNTIFDVFKHPKSYIATLGLLSFSISMILAGISIFKINKICALCFVTYFIDLLIAIVAKSKGSFFAQDIKATFVDFIDGVKKYTLLFILALVTFIALVAYTSTSLVLSPNLKMQKSFDSFAKMRKNEYAVSGNILGDPKGEKVYIYSDFLCPFCKITNIMMSKFAQEQEGVEVIHKNFPLDNTCNKYVPNTVHPGACILAKYALAAQKQDKYWDMSNLIFDEQPKNESELLYLSEKININIPKLIQDAASAEIEQELQNQIEAAHKNGIYGTPTIVIDNIPYISAMPYYKIRLLYNQAQKRHKANKGTK